MNIAEAGSWNYTFVWSSKRVFTQLLNDTNCGTLQGKERMFNNPYKIYPKKACVCRWQSSKVMSSQIWLPLRGFFAAPGKFPSCNDTIPGGGDDHRIEWVPTAVSYRSFMMMTTSYLSSTHLQTIPLLQLAWDNWTIHFIFTPLSTNWSTSYTR